MRVASDKKQERHLCESRRKKEAKEMIDSISELIVAWLISFGLAFMTALTDGPFGLFDKVRTKIESTKCPGWIRTGISCPVCVGFWISAGVAVSMHGGILMWLSSFGFICVVTSVSPE